MKKSKALLILSLCFTPLLLNSCGQNEAEIFETKTKEIYQQAVSNGFTGTYEEWLESIRGPQGPKGDKGDTGAKGDQGETGPQGEKGDTGAKGDQGEKGDTGAKGDQGDKGDTGSKGDQGIQGEKGDTGAKGDQGEKGDQGLPGKDGLDGKSAYEIYKEAHPEYTKTEAEWLDDLVNGRLANKETHRVSFKTNCSTQIETAVVEHCTKIAEPEKIDNPGYVFEGWYYNGMPWSFVGYVVTEDMTLEAKWAKAELTVVINYDNDKLTETRSYNYNDQITLEDQTKPGYRFIGWKDQDYNKLVFPLTITRDLTLTAQYSNSVDITFDSKGGSQVNKLSCYIGSNINELPIPTLEGKEFIGWFYDNGTTVEEIKLPYKNNFETNVTFEAHWKEADSNYTYEELPDGTLKLLTYTGDKTFIEVPGFIGDKKVSTIGATTYQNNAKITNVKVSDSITSIEDNAFKNCTALTNINFGYGVTTYGSTILAGCTKITDIKIRNNTSLVELFTNEAEMPNDIMVTPNYLERDNQFGNNYSKILFKNIINKTFNLTLTSDFKFANTEEFASTNVKTVYMEDGITSLYHTAFYDCRELIEVRLPETLITLSFASFNRCSKLTTVHVPETVEYMEGQAFLGCLSLTTVNIPSKVKVLGDSLFSGCKALTSIDIPQNVYRIEHNAFYGTSITTAVLPKNLVYLGGGAFENDTIARIYIPKTVKTIGTFLLGYGKPVNIYYEGSEQEWKNIIIEDNNGTLQNATFTYNVNY